MRGVAGVDLTDDLARELGRRGDRASPARAARVVLGPRHPRVGPGARGRARRRHRRRRRRRAHGRGHPDSRRRDAGGTAGARPGLRHLGLAQPVRRQRHQVPRRATGASCPTPPRPTSRRRWASAAGPGAAAASSAVEDAVERYADWLAETYGEGVQVAIACVVVRLRERGRRGRRPPACARASASTPAFIGADPDGRNINDRRGLDAPRRRGRGRARPPRLDLRPRVRRRRRPLPRGRRRGRPVSTATRSSRRSRSSGTGAARSRGDAGRRHVDDEPGLPPR